MSQTGNTVTKQQREHGRPEFLSGAIERVTFHNESTGFCVLKVKANGHQDLITVTGSAAAVSPGEYIDCEGLWFNDRTYGLQFKANRLSIVAPNTIEGIEKYLGSGMIKGIGPFFAKILVNAYGEQVFDIIDETPQKLLDLPGIGPKRLQCIRTAWAEQKIIRNIMVFLQSHGVGTSRAVRIYKTYGTEAIVRVSENPYRLALDIHGIGFKTADQIAQKLGIALNSVIRGQAGLRYTLLELSNDGHCCYEYFGLVEKTSTLLSIDTSIVKEALQTELQTENLVCETIAMQQYVYLPAFFKSETGIAAQLHRLCHAPLPWVVKDESNAIQWVEHKNGISLSSSQLNALKVCLKNKVTVLTGGPGVGKTTLIRSILQILRAKQMKVLLAAPTGRAAKRLSESCGIQAKTIHRLLEFDPKINTFRYSKDNPLHADLVVIDEVSMIDVVLMNQLLRAVSTKTALILVGDVDQLPSVGPGSVLHDIIDSNTIATVRLTEIFRQESCSQIIVNAHKINTGIVPTTQAHSVETPDFFIIYGSTPDEIMHKLLQVVCERIPSRFGYDPIRDIQVLTPMNRGGLGSRQLNIELKNRLNADSIPQVSKYGTSYSSKDKVIQIVNNYEKEVFNGDIGTVTCIDLDEALIHIEFDGRDVTYEFSELDELQLAYAASIHKSQGSEYPVVVIPLAMQHYMMLERNLLYTGVTRGKKLVILIAEPRALAICVKNRRTAIRTTHLRQRMHDLFISIV